MTYVPHYVGQHTAFIVVVAAAWLAGTPGSVAYDWYPPWCCSANDCRALSKDRGETVDEAPNGWRLWDGRVVRRENGRPSPDLNYHLCEEPTTKAIICFFAPPRSS